MEENGANSRVKFLALDPGSKVCGGYIQDMHGHIGPDGARGSILSFSKLSKKVIFGHFHKSMRLNDALGLGRLCLDPHYAKGKLSSWTLGIIVTHINSEAQNIDFHKSIRNNVYRYTTFLDTGKKLLK